jgi:hypothetical protein
LEEDDSEKSESIGSGFELPQPDLNNLQKIVDLVSQGMNLYMKEKIINAFIKQVRTKSL